MHGGQLRATRMMLTGTLLLAAAASCSAADFGLSATLRAGLSNTGDWELGIGPAGDPTRFNANLSPYYPNDAPRQFELGYTSATNTAFLRYYHNASTSQTVFFAPGGPGLGAGSVWTIPLGSLFVSSAWRPRPTSVTVDQLALGGGVSVLQPFSTTTLTAAHTTVPVTTSLTGPVVFRTGASGNWLLSGRISFAGLSAYLPAGAQRSQLQFLTTISGTSETVPEPPAFALLAVGMIVLGLLGRRKLSVEEA